MQKIVIFSNITKITSLKIVGSYYLFLQHITYAAILNNLFRSGIPESLRAEWHYETRARHADTTKIYSSCIFACFIRIA
jgi:hypothetical protein